MSSDIRIFMHTQSNLPFHGVPHVRAKTELKDPGQYYITLIHIS